ARSSKYPCSMEESLVEVFLARPLQIGSLLHCRREQDSARQPQMQCRWVRLTPDSRHPSQDQLQLSKEGSKGRRTMLCWWSTLFVQVIQTSKWQRGSWQVHRNA